MALKPKRSGLGLNLRSFTGKDGKSYPFSHTGKAKPKANGTSLRPVSPGGTGKDARWIDIHEDDLDEAQMANGLAGAAPLIRSTTPSASTTC